MSRLDSENARARSEEALALARKLGDRRTEARSLWSLLLTSTWFDPPQALEYGESGLVIARELAAQPDASNDDLELLALILLDLSFPLINAGKIKLARERTVEAKGLFEELGNMPMVSTATQRIGAIYKVEGRYDQAIETYNQSIAMDRSMGNEGGLIGGHIGLLELYPQIGDFANFFEAKLRFIKQWLNCTYVHNLGQLRQNCSVIFSLMVVQHWDQHEDNVYRQAFKVGWRQIQLQQGYRCGDVSIQCRGFEGICHIGSTY